MIKNLSRVAREIVLEKISDPWESNLFYFPSFSKDYFVGLASRLYKSNRLSEKDISKAIRENQKKETILYHLFPFRRLFANLDEFRSYTDFLNRSTVVEDYTWDITHNSKAFL